MMQNCVHKMFCFFFFVSGRLVFGHMVGNRKQAQCWGFFLLFLLQEINIICYNNTTKLSLTIITACALGAEKCLSNSPAAVSEVNSSLNLRMCFIHSWSYNQALIQGRPFSHCMCFEGKYLGLFCMEMTRICPGLSFSCDALPVPFTVRYLTWYLNLHPSQQEKCSPAHKPSRIFYGFILWIDSSLCTRVSFSIYRRFFFPLPLHWLSEHLRFFYILVFFVSAIGSWDLSNVLHVFLVSACVGCCWLSSPSSQILERIVTSITDHTFTRPCFSLKNTFNYNLVLADKLLSRGIKWERSHQKLKLLKFGKMCFTIMKHIVIQLSESWLD